MSDVHTAPTATAAQTSAAGTRMLGYYLGGGGVKVDCLFDTALFLKKAATGEWEAQTSAGKLSIAPNGSASVGIISSGSMVYGVAAASGHHFQVNGVTVAQIGPGSGGEIARFNTPAARGSGTGFVSIYDPSGRKGYWGYGGGNDTMYLQNTMNASVVFGTNNASRWMIDNVGLFYPTSDNAYSVGVAGNRPSVIYAATGTINTSDAREKTWRGAPTEGELAAARRIAAELGFYQWNGAIAEKGADGARMHFGVRAQAAWAIMADEGLIDPTAPGVTPDCSYAFLCYDEWPGVEAVAEERDEEGNITVAAVEARPAGNRFGIRPDQLTLFLIAAQEARLAALEARLAALEAA